MTKKEIKNLKNVGLYGVLSEEDVKILNDYVNDENNEIEKQKIIINNLKSCIKNVNKNTTLNIGTVLLKSNMVYIKNSNDDYFLEIKENEFIDILDSCDLIDYSNIIFEDNFKEYFFYKENLNYIGSIKENMYDPFGEDTISVWEYPHTDNVYFIEVHNNSCFYSYDNLEDIVEYNIKPEHYVCNNVYGDELINIVKKIWFSNPNIKFSGVITEENGIDENIVINFTNFAELPDSNPCYSLHRLAINDNEEIYYCSLNNCNVHPFDCWKCSKMNKLNDKEKKIIEKYIKEDNHVDFEKIEKIIENHLNDDFEY